MLMPVHNHIVFHFPLIFPFCESSPTKKHSEEREASAITSNSNCMVHYYSHAAAQAVDLPHPPLALPSTATVNFTQHAPARVHPSLTTINCRHCVSKHTQLLLLYTSKHKRKKCMLYQIFVAHTIVLGGKKIYSLHSVSFSFQNPPRAQIKCPS